ncbi:MAG: L,D-transpeptidase [Ignavibacteria bacterium]|nr:L,D-transpeptidase [Ignavibacteria bacterium]
MDEIIIEIPEENTTQKKPKDLKLAVVFPFVLIIYLIAGVSNEAVRENNIKSSGFYEISVNADTSVHRYKYNILSEVDLSAKLKDTVYTTLDSWLELRIDQQMVYQHWRDGRTKSYPVSTGNKLLSRSTDSKPGLFAIFFKNAHHRSSQYNNADMYHFMPFNQGNGFHSLNGTGYYAALGKYPSSHGCIRMRHEDVKKLFNDSPLGTLVLAHNGYTARTVGFAPKDYIPEHEFSKDEYKLMLAKNLYNILNGNYYTKERYYVVIDPKVVPSSGIYISYKNKIPERQNLPKSYYTVRFINNDRLIDRTDYLSKSGNLDRQVTFIGDTKIIEKELNNDEPEAPSEIEYTDEELINKYFKNPIGILPYYGPK